MAREIKFRAWDTWCDQYFEKIEDVFISLSGRVAMYTGIGSPDYGGFDEYQMRFLLEQYTGLKDFNGVEIYEGDILKDVDDSTIVGFVEYDEAFGEYDCGNNNLYECTRDCIVIGNIHKNPELVEEC